MGKVIQLAKKSIDLISRIGGGLYTLATEPTRLSDKLVDEITYLRAYYSTPKGIAALLEMYLEAETALIQEPAGLIDRTTGEFSFFNLDDERKRRLEKVINKDETEIKKLLDSLKGRIRKSSWANAENHFCTSFIKELKEYQEGNNNFPEILRYFFEDFSKDYVSPAGLDRNGKIEVHVHPRTRFVTKDENGEDVVLVTKKGYSEADRGASRLKTLGLIEYKSEMMPGRNPQLFLDINISHRVFFWDGKVGRARLSIGIDDTKAIGVDGNSFVMKTPKRGVSRAWAIDKLYSNVRLFPLIEYDPCEAMEVSVIPIIGLGNIQDEEIERELMSSLVKFDMERECRVVGAVRNNWGEEEAKRITRE
jgi:hypothetical protein